MKKQMLVIFLIISAVIVSGCTGQSPNSQENGETEPKQKLEENQENSSNPGEDENQLSEYPEPKVSENNISSDVVGGKDSKE